MNLVDIWLKNQHDFEYQTNPLFLNPLLNKAIIIKHQLRSHEQDIFADNRAMGTKILLPLDARDLKFGGQYIFVNQKNYQSVLESTFGEGVGSNSRDRVVLNIMDESSSLDPFLLREKLKRFDIAAADVYSEISRADIEKMHAFATKEVGILVNISLGGSVSNLGVKTRKLVSKMLASTFDEDLEPLRINLRMQPSEFSEGIFCWRGFLYYKWAHSVMKAQMNAVLFRMVGCNPRELLDSDRLDHLVKVRLSLARSVIATIAHIEQDLNAYDVAYGALTSQSNPQVFRHFLLTASTMFEGLGDRLGVLGHIISFWNFRFPAGKEPIISFADLIHLLTGFESSLSFAPRRKGKAKQA
jgi:hypothetical protein